jgi:Zn-dependent alcohol dehydrogenase
VKTDVACLCNSTDGKLVAGHFPGVNTYPLILGHEGTGIVQAVGPKVRTFKVGDRVIGGLLFEFSDPHYASGWGGFCEFTLANDHDAMVADGVADADHGWFEVYEIQRPVDPEVPAEAAVLLCTWREVYGAFGDFNLKPNDRILVFGAGPVGLSFVRFGKLLGLSWIGVVDPLPKKREHALQLGADAVYRPDDMPQIEKDFSRSLDAVIDAVGNENLVNLALPLVKMGGSIGIYGVISSTSIPLDKSLGPYNFNLYVHQWPTRWRERQAQKPLCDWIRQGKLKFSDFVTHEFPIEQINEALAAVQRGEVIKCLLRY